jgi:hypothetical protein
MFIGSKAGPSGASEGPERVVEDSEAMSKFR